jgi:TPR repeat protein
MGPKSTRPMMPTLSVRQVALMLALCLQASPGVAQISSLDWSEIGSVVGGLGASIVPTDPHRRHEPALTSAGVGPIRQTAERGDALAQFHLGQAYEDDDGLLPDEEQAHLWYRKAADQRFPPAEFAVGMDYARGRGIPQDDEKAVEWVRRAATQGYALAQCSLGMAYVLGKGIERDGRASIPWFQKAADQGLAEGQFRFAVMSIAFSGLLGTGVGNGVGAAVDSLRRAADQDFGPAQFALGMLSQGNPLADPDTNLIHQDIIESYKWFTICWKRTVGELQSSCGRHRFEIERKMEPDAIGDGEDRALEWIDAFSRRRR